VIDHIFGAGLGLAAILSLDRLDAAVAERVREALNALDTAVAKMRAAAYAVHVSGIADPRCTHTAVGGQER